MLIRYSFGPRSSSQARPCDRTGGAASGKWMWSGDTAPRTITSLGYRLERVRVPSKRLFRISFIQECSGLPFYGYAIVRRCLEE